MKTAVIQTSSAGDNTIVSAIPGKMIRVLRYTIGVSANDDVTWKSGSTTLSGPLYLGGHNVLSSGVPVLTPGGLTYEFQTAPGEALVLNVSGSASVGGHLVYQEILA